MSHSDDFERIPGRPLCGFVPHQRSGKWRFPEDSQGRSTTNDCEDLYAGGGKWRNSARKRRFRPIWPKTQIRNPKRISNPKVEIQNDSPHPRPLSQNGRGEEAPFPRPLSPPSTMSGTLYPWSWSRRGEPSAIMFCPQQKWARQQPETDSLWPRMARFRLIPAPLPTCGCVTPKNSKPCVFPLLLAISPERYPGRWGNQYNH